MVRLEQLSIRPRKSIGPDGASVHSGFTLTLPSQRMSLTIRIGRVPSPRQTGQTRRAAELGTLRQGKQVVIPLPVRVGPQIWPVGPIYDTDGATVPADQRIERVHSLIYRIDHLLARPFPTIAAEMGNTLVGILARLRVYAGHLHVGHFRGS